VILAVGAPDVNHECERRSDSSASLSPRVADGAERDDGDNTGAVLVRQAHSTPRGTAHDVLESCCNALTIGRVEEDRPAGPPPFAPQIGGGQGWVK